MQLYSSAVVVHTFIVHWFVYNSTQRGSNPHSVSLRPPYRSTFDVSEFQCVFLGDSDNASAKKSAIHAPSTSTKVCRRLFVVRQACLFHKVKILWTQLACFKLSKCSFTAVEMILLFLNVFLWNVFHRCLRHLARKTRHFIISELVCPRGFLEKDTKSQTFRFLKRLYQRGW